MPNLKQLAAYLKASFIEEIFVKKTKSVEKHFDLK